MLLALLKIYIHYILMLGFGEEQRQYPVPIGFNRWRDELLVSASRDFLRDMHEMFFPLEKFYIISFHC
jgi:hypothetical protein